MVFSVIVTFLCILAVGVALDLLVLRRHNTPLKSRFMDFAGVAFAIFGIFVSLCVLGRFTGLL